MANEEYLEMIELPVSSCEMVVVPKKKKFARDRLIKRVNKKLRVRPEKDEQKNANIDKSAETEAGESNIVLYEKAQKKKFRFDIVTAQVIAIFALVVAILLTNVFWENSGINTLIRSVFNPEKQAEKDERSYTAFKASVPCGSDNITTENGVMTLKASCAVYPLAEGSVTDISEKDGKFTVTVSHSEVFKSVISGLDYSYVELGDKVFTGIPLGYLDDSECTVTMYNGGSVVTGYAVDGGAIVWES